MAFMKKSKLLHKATVIVGEELGCQIVLIMCFFLSWGVCVSSKEEIRKIYKSRG